MADGVAAMICPNCRVDKESTLASAKALLKERDELRDRVEQLEADREKLLKLLESASEVIGRFVSDEGWAQSDMDMMDTIDAEIVRMRRAAQ